ncbi:MAG: DinB family protein [Desulfatitalea sp.]|nr:DinB family protein [Desulfatitalea sp.]NNK00393.1 DinB family protein [Desulfatitalea sp.]
MSTKAEALARRIDAFNQQAMTLVKKIPETDWLKTCEAEQWSVGVVARHIGAGHYGAMEMAKLLIEGQPLPELTYEQIVQMANAHAAKHADCTKAQVLSILESEGGKLVAFITGLSDAVLARSANMPAFGGEVSVEQLLSRIILDSGGEHVDSIEKTIASGG